MDNEHCTIKLTQGGFEGLIHLPPPINCPMGAPVCNIAMIPL